MFLLQYCELAFECSSVLGEALSFEAHPGGLLGAPFSRVLELCRRSVRRWVPRRYLLLSYPKSGRTWIRFMLNFYLAKRYRREVRHVFEIEADRQIGRRHPLIYTHLTGAMVLKRPYYDLGTFPERKTIVPNSHAVLLTRNIYSTLASAYFQARLRLGDFSGTPSEFIRDPRYGAIKIISFYNLWLELHPEFLSTTVFSYEEVRADPQRALRRLLEAVGITPVDSSLVAEVVGESCFARMQQIALSDAYARTVLAPASRENRDSWKVRDGNPKGFRDVFSGHDLDYISRLIDDLLVDKRLVDSSR